MKKSSFIFTAMVSVSVVLPLQACAPVGLVVGAGAATGVAAYQERGVDGAARDLRISTYIFDKFLRADHVLLKDVGVEVYEGRVLLTGQVPTADLRAEAVRLAWSVDGTKDVFNEIQVTAESGLLDTARDTWITGQLQTRLTFDEKVLALNYVVETVGGTVYLIGIAQNAAELERVKNQARSIPYVQRIVSHVRIKNPVVPSSFPAASSSSPSSTPSANGAR